MRKLFNVVATLAVVLGTGAGHGAGMTLDVLPNWVGAGVGVTTEWAGAKDTAVALAPGGRVQFSEHRFVEVYGPFLNVNLLNVQGWEFGPSVSYRFGLLTTPGSRQLRSQNAAAAGRVRPWFATIER